MYGFGSIVPYDSPHSAGSVWLRDTGVYLTIGFYSFSAHFNVSFVVLFWIATDCSQRDAFAKCSLYCKFVLSNGHRLHRLLSHSSWWKCEVCFNITWDSSVYLDHLSLPWSLPSSWGGGVIVIDASRSDMVVDIVTNVNVHYAAV